MLPGYLFSSEQLNHRSCRPTFILFRVFERWGIEVMQKGMQTRTVGIRKSYLFLFLSTISALFLAIIWWHQYKQDQQQAHYIAVAGPMTGAHGDKGAAMVAGAQLMLDAYNNQRSTHQAAIKLKIFDDKNQINQAIKTANEIIKDTSILAVIGHRYSSTSEVAAPIYQQHGLPIISGTASADRLTSDIPYFFRTTFNNGYQAKFIAEYLTTVLEQEKVSIVYGNDNYGQSFAQNFTQAVDKQGMNLIQQWRVEPKHGSIKHELPAIIEEMRTGPDPGMIFVATRDSVARDLIVKMRDEGIQFPIIGGTAIGKQSFPSLFNHLPQEKKTPGYYTDGIYATSGLIFDASGERAQQFRDDFYQRFGYEPDSAAAAYYDATYLLTQAISQHTSTKVDSTEATTDNTREAIVHYLQSINSLQNAAIGIAAPFYFDDQGNAVKPVAIGQYFNNHLISAPIQLQFRHQDKFSLKPDNDEENINIGKDEAPQLDHHALTKTHIVYTGLMVDKISDLDLKTFSHEIEFLLWFRSSTQIDPANIEFLNAIEPIILENPVDQVSEDQEIYQAYKVKGRFKGDSLNSDIIGSSRSYGEHLLGLHFRHKTLDHKELIYVTDSITMPRDYDQRVTPYIQGQQVLHTDRDWRIDHTSLFQDIVSANTSGQPWLQQNQMEGLQHSRFNLVIRIKEAKLQLRNLVPEKLAFELFLGSITLFLLLHALRSSPCGRRYPKSLWLTEVLSIYLALICLEAITVDKFNHTLDKYQMEMIIKCFDSLWWIFGAILMTAGIRQIVWMPLEVRTGQKPPKIIQAIQFLLACTFAGFGIVAFVLGHELTSLLATSGILAMIIGLAVQMNLSNFFSGIAINVERPFGVGDFIKIGTLGTGRVTDITWRTTRLQTASGEVISIPNTLSAESTVINYSQKGGGYQVTLVLYLDPNHNPSEVISLLKQAVRPVQETHPRLMNEEDIAISFQGITRQGAEYKVFVKTVSFMPGDPGVEAISKKIWQTLDQAGIQQLTDHTWFGPNRPSSMGHRPTIAATTDTQEEALTG